jgi:hypothetical protein
VFWKSACGSVHHKVFQVTLLVMYPGGSNTINRFSLLRASIRLCYEYGRYQRDIARAGGRLITPRQCHGGSSLPGTGPGQVRHDDCGVNVTTNSRMVPTSCWPPVRLCYSKPRDSKQRKSSVMFYIMLTSTFANGASDVRVVWTGYLAGRCRHCRVSLT